MMHPLMISLTANPELAPDSQPQPHDVAPEMQALDAPEPEPEAVLTDWQDEVLSADHTDTSRGSRQFGRRDARNNGQSLRLWHGKTTTSRTCRVSLRPI